MPDAFTDSACWCCDGTDCPCCQGKTEADPMALCDHCLASWMAQNWGHDCYRPEHLR